MNSVAIDQLAIDEVKPRRVIEGEAPTVLTDIYQDDCNIVIWKRHNNPELNLRVHEFVESNAGFQVSMTVSPDSALEALDEALGGNNSNRIISEDIAELVSMFCCLFDLERAGLRLTVLNKAMCPKFHVDHVPCRLITTYQGVATEWLLHDRVDRAKLGKGSGGKPDHESGLYQSSSDIQQLNAGSVALLKGERWDGNEGAGLVHRSPAVAEDKARLLLTLDIS